MQRANAERERLRRNCLGAPHQFGASRGRGSLRLRPQSITFACNFPLTTLSRDAGLAHLARCEHDAWGGVMWMCARTQSATSAAEHRGSGVMWRLVLRNGDQSENSHVRRARTRFYAFRRGSESASLSCAHSRPRAWEALQYVVLKPGAPFISGLHSTYTAPGALLTTLCLTV